MDDAIFFAALFLILFLSSKFLMQTKAIQKNLPPGPPALPMLGHLHLLKHPIHRSLHKLSQKYGPIMSIRFGSRKVVIISSSSAVQECFTVNDVVLANRPPLLVAKHISYNSNTISSASYGVHWRNLRRLGAEEIFSSHRLNFFMSIRRDEVRRLLRKLLENSKKEFSKVELQSLLTELTFNNVMRMVASKRYFGEDVSNEEEAKQFRLIMKQFFEVAGATNAGDFLPFLIFGPFGYERKIKDIGKRFDALLQGLVDEHRGKERGNSMIDHLLSSQESEPENFNDLTIKALIMDIIIGGTNSSTVTLEWAMSNLLNHPDILEKARTEVDSQLGQDRLVEESDTFKLHYIRGIINETFRLNPPIPLLLPHYSSEDCKIGGYDVKPNTILLVNAWAIHRDPSIWEDPLAFKPERHMNRNLDAYMLLPFGVGRRACPGVGMAQRIISLTLASLIQCFEWERVSGEEVDMTGGKGLAVPKAQQLKAMFRARPIMEKVLAQSLQSI